MVPFQSPNTRPDPYKFTGIFLFNFLIPFLLNNLKSGAGLYCVSEDKNDCSACRQNNENQNNSLTDSIFQNKISNILCN